MHIQAVVRYHAYRPSNFQDTDPICAVCGKSLGHSITLIVMGDDDAEQEIHSDCLPKEEG